MRDKAAPEPFYVSFLFQAAVLTAASLLVFGASVGFAVSSSTGSLAVGLCAAALFGGVFNLLLGPLVVGRGANQLASGLALMFLGQGL